MMAHNHQAQMLFVLCSERSGSTLLTRMLNRHPTILAPAELWLLRYPDGETWHREKPQAIHSLCELAESLNLPSDPSRLIEKFKKTDTLSIYQTLRSLAPPNSVLVDKTPAYANDPTILERTIPLEPYFVHLIRHPLGVIDSESRLVEKRIAAEGKNSHWRSLKLSCQRILNQGFTHQERRREAKWLLQNKNILNFLRRVPETRKTTLIFEELILDPSTHLKSLCQLLRVPFVASMLEPFASPTVIKPGMGNPNFHQRSRIETTPIHAWHARYSPQQLKPEVRLWLQTYQSSTWKR